ncbi:histone H3-K79 methyltransferase [Diplogelasinospora grovesii]|uniref:Histone-lysine N-methyltransferase, H3 lysine-79 specific n=1 Tax=Diplogelasinospora grovesii TaxID=303347 RepID=A0AAN6MWT3_9PEZI|nr:histone H3-K79 methyltransferase [Diplogelasinospora grovesii]
MSIFNQKSKFKVKTEVRAIKQAVAPPPKPKPKKPTRSDGGANGNAPLRAQSRVSTTTSSASTPSPSSLLSVSDAYVRGGDNNNNNNNHRDRKRSRKGAAGDRRLTPALSPSFGTESSDEEDADDDWEQNLDARKRRKRDHQPAYWRIVDANRTLRHPRLWTGDEADIKKVAIIHAAEVASLRDEGKCQPVLGLKPDEVAVKLQYPGTRYPERYELVWGKDKIEAVKDIMKVVNYVASTYLTDDEAEPFLNQNTGIYRRLEKSSNTNDGPGFKAALKEYNEQLLALQKKGAIAKNIDAMREVPKELIEFILDQVYDRTVAPKVELLAKYKNGTDNVYGELLHPFISDILDRTEMTSDKVFVDLGSGVGNVVLQAAIEIGCESWGCEMMENACNLAEAQQKEFTARCRLWGFAPGKVQLERGDFRKNERILAALKRADVVLVNNQAFTSQLNDNLVSMFLDLKVGCKIVSLKTFVHDNKNAENDVASSILDVEHLEYPSDYVSWTSVPGNYCISTKKA